MMKMKCSRRDLVEAVSLVEKAVPVATPINVLEGIFIEAKENAFKLVGNNMNLGIECYIPAEVEEKGLAMVKASLFSQAVKKLPDTDEDVFMEIDEKDNLKIECGYAKFNFTTSSAEEFPQLPLVLDGKSFEIKESLVKNMIKQTVYAVSTREEKPVLTGVLFDVEESDINVVGCDGFRVAIRKEEIENSENLKFILPGKNAKELLGIMGESDELIKISVNENNVKFTLDKCILVSRIIDGEYLNYKSVANHKNTLEFVVERRKILNSIDRAATIVNEASKSHVLLDIDETSVSIDCESVMGKVKDKFSIDMQGEPMQIAFNPKYLIEAFKNAEDEKIKLSFSTPVTPAIIRPVNGEKYVYIILPVRIK